MIEIYRNSIMEAKNAGIPLKPRTIDAGDLIAAKKNGRLWPCRDTCCRIHTVVPKA